jgi:hypothetical protein
MIRAQALTALLSASADGAADRGLPMRSDDGRRTRTKGESRKEKTAQALISGHIFKIGFSYGHERGNKKTKSEKKGNKPEIPAFLPFLPFLSFLLPSRLSLPGLNL